MKGTITSESGEPLIGATIAVKNSTDGTVTDIDGNYSLKTKKTLSSKDLLLFSYVGYKTLQKNYTGNTMNVKLAEESQQLNDVVVTALGIKRGEKGLGYATETVKGDKITSALPSNWSTALNGKVAGLSVISSGGPLNSSRISLRGDVSLNQNGNDALVVVDGVPMSSPMTNPGVAYGAGSNSELSVDYGNGFSDINPDDIESIQVLKGASATALYGTRAANGVIMVTTKSGAGAPKGIGVSYSGNFSIDDVMRCRIISMNSDKDCRVTSVRQGPSMRANHTTPTEKRKTAATQAPAERVAHTEHVSMPTGNSTNMIR